MQAIIRLPFLPPRCSMASMSAPYELALPPTDALPYYDDEIDKVGMRSKVEREIAKEMKAAGGSESVAEDRLPPALELFKVRRWRGQACKRHPLTASPLQDRPELAALLEKAGKGEAMNALNRSRYQLAAPTQGTEASDEEWTASLRNAEAQLMHSEARLTNLELLKKYGGECARVLVCLHADTDVDTTQQTTGDCTTFSRRPSCATIRAQ